MMAEEFPIPIPSRLPVRIDPCPIAEAVLELRFVTSESWRTLPGLLFGTIRERYPQQKDLPLAEIPEEVRRRQSTLTYQPLVQFFGHDFLIQFGPRVVSLVTKPNQYPGWAAVEVEMRWLLDRLQSCRFISEGQRLAVRYINFFAFNIFSQLVLQVNTGDKSLAGGELSVIAALQRPPLTARLQVTNGGILGTGEGAQHGSLLDIDAWMGPLDFDMFQNGLEKFREAHDFEKQIFFGLLKPEFLATLNPVYE